MSHSCDLCKAAHHGNSDNNFCNACKVTITRSLNEHCIALVDILPQTLDEYTAIHNAVTNQCGGVMEQTSEVIPQENEDACLAEPLHDLTDCIMVLQEQHVQACESLVPQDITCDPLLQEQSEVYEMIQQPGEMYELVQRVQDEEFRAIIQCETLDVSDQVQDKNVIKNHQNLNVQTQRTSPQIIRLKDFVVTQNLEKVSKNTEIKPKRGKVKNADQWKKNIRKQKRAFGEGYISCRGKEVKPRRPKERCTSACKFRCKDFTEEDRTKICSSFWSVGDTIRQKDFLLSHVHRLKTKRKTTDLASRRQFSRNYSLPLHGQHLKVCKKFFCSTLCISHGPIDDALNNRIGDFFVKKKELGPRVPYNKTPREQLEIAQNHIRSIPTIESHYCRKDNKHYIEPSKSLKKTYESYVKECRMHDKEPISEYIYRRVCKQEFHLAEFRPKKEQCEVCYYMYKPPDVH